MLPAATLQAQILDWIPASMAEPARRRAAQQW